MPATVKPIVTSASRTARTTSAFQVMAAATCRRVRTATSTSAAAATSAGARGRAAAAAGGSSTGGSSTGGSSTGSSTGGSSTGGSATGGTSVGGVSADACPAGASSAGGTSTGGCSPGAGCGGAGSSVVGSSAGGWLGTSVSGSAGCGGGCMRAGPGARFDTQVSVACTRRRSCSTQRGQLRRWASRRREPLAPRGPSSRSEISRSARSHQPLPGRVATVRRMAAIATSASARASTSDRYGSAAASSRAAATGSIGPAARDGTGRSGACSIGRPRYPWRPSGAAPPGFGTVILDRFSGDLGGSVADYANDVLVDTQWVENHLNDESIRIVEVDENPALYAEAHIPGAIGFDWKKDLQDQVKRDFLGPAEFGELFGSRGVANEHTIVLYGDRNNWFAAYTYWYLKYYGHHNVRLMNGPREKWISEGRPTSTDVPSYSAQTFNAQEGDPAIRAKRDEVLDALDSKTRLVDVRSPQEFSGELIAMAGYEQEGAQRAGHIPGAASVPWAQAVKEDGTFKSADELRELYSGKGVVDGNAIIAYCRIGERSAHTWFVLHELLGESDVKNYDSSWTEWGNMVAVPIEEDG